MEQLSYFSFQPVLYDWCNRSCTIRRYSSRREETTSTNKSCRLPYTHTHTHTYIQTWIHTDIQIWIHTCIHTYRQTRTYTYIFHIYTCIHNTYIHTYGQISLVTTINKLTQHECPCNKHNILTSAGHCAACFSGTRRLADTRSV